MKIQGLSYSAYVGISLFAAPGEDATPDAGSGDMPPLEGEDGDDASKMEEVD